MKILILDRTGHSTLSATDTDLQVEFDRLAKAGYAMFLNDEKLVSKNLKVADLPAEAEVLALAPLVGG